MLTFLRSPSWKRVSPIFSYLAGGAHVHFSNLPDHTTPSHLPSKMDVLPKTYLQIILAAKWLVRHSSSSPNSSDDLCLLFCTNPPSMAELLWLGVSKIKKLALNCWMCLRVSCLKLVHLWQNLCQLLLHAVPLLLRPRHLVPAVKSPLKRAGSIPRRSKFASASFVNFSNCIYQLKCKYFTLIHFAKYVMMRIMTLKTS